MDNQLDIGYIKTLIQNILNESHSVEQKKEIREYSDSLKFACPICGDSERYMDKKRGTLYFKNMMFICYNNYSCNRTFTKLLNTFGQKMELDKKLEIYDYIENNVHKYSSDDTAIKSLDKLYSIDELLEVYGKTDISKKLTMLSPIRKGGAVDYYLKTRRIYHNTHNIFEGIYHYTPKWKQPVMVFMNMSKGKVVSMQLRNLLEGQKRMYKVLDFSYIWNQIHPEEPLDDQEKISYNKISYFFNLFNINFNNIVNIFEGYLDSITIPNSIGMVGLDTDISFLKNESGVELRFIFDNDRAGFKKAEKMMENGNNVFLWNKFFLDLLSKKSGDRIQNSKKLSSNIKDFSKLATYYKTPIHNNIELDKYFSNNKLDKIYFHPLEELVTTSLLIK